MSGLVGFDYRRLKQAQGFLSKNGYTEYGFRSRIEAAAFAGAYVLNAVESADTTLFDRRTPSFSFDEGPFSVAISVGGDMHGDFRMSAATSVKSACITPAGKRVEFSPIKYMGVSGYHSIEPEILVGMIKAEIYANGAEGAKQLIAEFEAEIPNLIDGLEPKDPWPFAIPFADYGEGDSGSGSMFRLGSIEYALENQGKSDKEAVLSAAYLPQSSVNFEMAVHDRGLSFYNRHKDEEKPDNQIVIPRDQYASFFRILLAQSVAILGRTSPKEHLNLLSDTKSLLAGVPIEDIIHRRYDRPR